MRDGLQRFLELADAVERIAKHRIGVRETRIERNRLAGRRYGLLVPAQPRELWAKNMCALASFSSRATALGQVLAAAKCPDSMPACPKPNNANDRYCLALRRSLSLK